MFKLRVENRGQRFCSTDSDEDPFSPDESTIDIPKIKITKEDGSVEWVIKIVNNLL